MVPIRVTHVYAAVGVVLYTKLSRCQSEPLHSLSKPWSPPSQLPLVFWSCMRSLNLSSPGVRTSTPELKISGHPTSGTAANSWGRVKRWDIGATGRTSASRKTIFEYWVKRKTCSFVRTVLRSGRPRGSEQSVLVELCPYKMGKAQHCSSEHCHGIPNSGCKADPMTTELSRDESCPGRKHASIDAVVMPLALMRPATQTTNAVVKRLKKSASAHQVDAVSCHPPARLSRRR